MSVQVNENIIQVNITENSSIVTIDSAGFQGPAGGTITTGGFTTTIGITGISVSGSNSITGLLKINSDNTINLNLNGNSLSFSSNVSGSTGSNLSNVVFQTGNQSISGIKTFSNATKFNSNIDIAGQINATNGDAFIDSSLNVQIESSDDMWTVGNMNNGATFLSVKNFDTNDGFVGINKNNPIFALDVNGTTNTDNLLLNGTDITGIFYPLHNNPSNYLTTTNSGALQNQITIIQNGPQLYIISGNPEGQLSAISGSLCTDWFGAKLYQKITGSSVNGWI